MKRLLRALRIFVLFAVVGGLGMALFRHLYRPGLDDYAAHRYTPPPAGERALRATWLGTTAVLLDDGQSSLFIDPFFTRPSGWWRLIANRPIAPDEEAIARGLVQARLANLDGVLVSHSHYDHAMDAAVVARLGGAELVGSQSTANIGRGGGLPESQLRVVKSGQPLLLGNYVVTFLQSRHAGATGGRPTGDIEAPLTPPARYLDYKQGGTYSILIEHDLGAVLLHGSAGYVPGALKGRKADVVFLGIALRDNLPEYLREVVDAVGARRVVPTHWDDFTRPLSAPPRPMIAGVDLDEFFENMARERPDLEVQTLDLGAPVVLLTR